MMPSIFGENLFDEFFDDDFPMIPMRSIRNPLYGKNAKNLMKTDVRETDDTYELDVDLPGFTVGKHPLKFVPHGCEGTRNPAVSVYTCVVPFGVLLYQCAVVADLFGNGVHEPFGIL